MRVLGLDQGLRHTGWGVIDVDGNALAHVANGVISPPPGEATAARLAAIFAAVREILDAYRPGVAAVEETFLNRNPASTLKLGLARGAALVAAASAGLPVSEYAARLVKKAIVGTGRADKRQVAAMIAVLLPGAVTGSADAADALAVAVCHAHHALTMGPRRQLASVRAASRLDAPRRRAPDAPLRPQARGALS